MIIFDSFSSARWLPTPDCFLPSFLLVPESLRLGNGPGSNPSHRLACHWVSQEVQVRLLLLLLSFVFLRFLHSFFATIAAAR